MARPPLNDTLLQELYLHQKKTLDQIADETGHSQSHLGLKKKEWGIPTLRRWERYNLPPIEGRLRSLLVGSMLGDASISLKDTAACLSETHAESQKPYLDWKRDLWGDWIVSYSSRAAKGGAQPQWNFTTHPHGDILEWRRLFYGGPRPKGQDYRRKRFLPEIVPLVDEFALAVWFQDDGTCTNWPGICFGIDEDSRQVCFDIFEKFGLRPEWYSSNRRNPKSGAFWFKREHGARFLDLVRPHMHPCMSYKTEASSVVVWRKRKRRAVQLPPLVKEAFDQGLTAGEAAEQIEDFPNTAIKEEYRVLREEAKEGIEERIVALGRQGKRTRAIVAEVPGDWKKVRAVLKKHGLSNAWKQIKYTHPELYRDLAQLLEERSIRSLAREHGLPRSRFLDAIEEQGIDYQDARTRSRPGVGGVSPTWDDAERLERLARAGMCVADIAREVGVSRDVVMGCAKRHDIDIPEGKAGRRRIVLEEGDVRWALERSSSETAAAKALRVTVPVLRRERARHGL